uniref:Uncharacterized protein n=1 Tax=Glossina morsitans morsitans TaxID=37546 RepID=A0A1B0F999_GLOMM
MVLPYVMPKFRKPNKRLSMAFLKAAYTYDASFSIKNKNLVLRESNVALGLQNASEERSELGEGKNGLKAVKNKMHQGEVGKINNPVTSLVSAGFQTANGKQISTSEEGQKSAQNILREFQSNLPETDYETELKGALRLHLNI